MLYAVLNLAVAIILGIGIIDERALLTAWWGSNAYADDVESTRGGPTSPNAMIQPSARALAAT